MRILIYKKDQNKNLKNIISNLEKDYVVKIDLFDDYEEAEYCVSTRFYDLIYDLIILEYEKQNRSKLLNFFKYARNKNDLSEIFLFSEDIKNSEVQLYEKYNINEILKEKLEEAKIEELIKGKVSTIIEHDILKVDVKEKKVWIIKDKEPIEIYFKKKTDFYVFLYFMRHYKETINVSNLLDATCEEPELTKDSIIESSISFKDIKK